METSKLTGERIKQYLEEGNRFDERKPDEFREIVIETGISKHAEGSARVKIGNTEVLVGVKMGVAEPYPDSPDKGNLIVTAELLPLSSERFETGPPKFPAIELGRLIDRGIRESKFIELEKLCIKEGEKVWEIFIDIYSINDDGNLIDAAGIGAIIALKTAKMPKYDEKEEKIIFGELISKNIPLTKNPPITITVYKIGEKFIVDPTKEEEDISETKVTVGGYDETISSIQKGNHVLMTIEEFHEVLKISEKVRKSVHKQLEKYIK